MATKIIQGIYSEPIKDETGRSSSRIISVYVVLVTDRRWAGPAGTWGRYGGSRRAVLYMCGAARQDVLIRYKRRAIITDGGMTPGTTGGDICKALASGADAVMSHHDRLGPLEQILFGPAFTKDGTRAALQASTRTSPRCRTSVCSSRESRSSASATAYRRWAISWGGTSCRPSAASTARRTCGC